MKLAQRAQSLKPSPTLELANRARELAAQGKDVVSLTVGEPDWGTFSVAAEAGIQAIREGFTKYTAAHGIPELRSVIAKEVSRQTKQNYEPNDVIVGAGAKFVLYSALQMLCDPQDEVLIPAPYWVSYPAMAELAGAVPKIIQCSETERFQLTPEKLKAAISEKTKVLILCSPSNPTGLRASAEELKALVPVLKENPNLFVISDDIYNRLLFTGEDVSPHLLHVAPELKDRLLIVNGASKSYSMTGWRVGWGVGPRVLMRALSDYLSQTTSNVATMSQRAAMAAISEGEPDLQKSVEALKIKKSFCVQQFSLLKIFRLIQPDGAFYLWVAVDAFFGREYKGQKIRNSSDVSKILLDEYYVAVVPGAEFGSEGFLRLSFAVSNEQLSKAFDRLKKFESEF